MHGLLLVDKPLYMSSMSVIRRVRRAARIGAAQFALQQGDPSLNRRVKCGHAGTLDPLATGLLIVGVGDATRTLAGWMDHAKTYEAHVRLDAFTPSDDLDTALQPVHVDAPPTLEDIRAGLLPMIGLFAQQPPSYSAVHVNGRRAYSLARYDHNPVQLPRRTVHVHAIDIVRYDWPDLHLRVTCGKGTYLRSIARDLGQSLGTGGHLAALRRTHIGPFHVDHATPIERFNHAIMPKDLFTPDESADVIPVYL